MEVKGSDPNPSLKKFAPFSELRSCAEAQTQAVVLALTSPAVA